MIGLGIPQGLCERLPTIRAKRRHPIIVGGLDRLLPSIEFRFWCADRAGPIHNRDRAGFPTVEAAQGDPEVAGGLYVLAKCRVVGDYFADIGKSNACPILFNSFDQTDSSPGAV